MPNPAARHPLGRGLTFVALAAFVAASATWAQGTDVVWAPTGPLPGAIQELWTAPGSTDVSYVLSNGRLFRSNDGWAPVSQSASKASPSIPPPAIT